MQNVVVFPGRKSPDQAHAEQLARYVAEQIDRNRMVFETWKRTYLRHVFVTFDENLACNDR